MTTTKSSVRAPTTCVRRPSRETQPCVHAKSASPGSSLARSRRSARGARVRRFGRGGRSGGGRSGGPVPSLSIGPSVNWGCIHRCVLPRSHGGQDRHHKPRERGGVDADRHADGRWGLPGIERGDPCRRAEGRGGVRPHDRRLPPRLARGDDRGVDGALRRTRCAACCRGAARFSARRARIRTRPKTARVRCWPRWRAIASTR